MEEQRQRAAMERTASLCAVIATVQTGKKHKPEQFLPRGYNRSRSDDGQPKRRLNREQTKDSLREFLMKTKAAFGEKRPSA